MTNEEIDRISYKLFSKWKDINITVISNIDTQVTFFIKYAENTPLSLLEHHFKYYGCDVTHYQTHGTMITFFESQMRLLDD